MISLLLRKFWWVPTAIVTLALGASLVTAHVIRNDRDRLHHLIYNPVDGYETRLTQCRTNVVNLEGTVNHQNAEILRLADLGATKLSAAERAVAEANKRASDSQRRYDRIMSQPLTGSTVCERIIELDARYVESLK